MNPSEPLACSRLGKTFHEVLTRALPLDEDVLSVSLVGSTISSESLSTVSDVDTIVVVSRLTERLFEACVNRVAALTGEDFGLPGYRVQVNSTFGPLKFDTEHTIVIHLMIYDVESHREHVLKSPFTCYDWEISPVVSGPSLRSLYPVLGLSPDGFLSARRSINNYLDDLSRGEVSYRSYRFSPDGQVEQDLCMFPLDERHQAEYAYHIVRNLVCNYAKLLTKTNASLHGAPFYSFWQEHLEGTPEELAFFKVLEKAKRNHGNYPDGACAFAENFLRKFFSTLQAFWGPKSRKVVVYRHAATPLNTAQFLGQGRDPDISPDDTMQPAAEQVDELFCSPLARARQTAAMLFPGRAAAEDARLAEIDYGEVEGLPINQLSEAFPDLNTAWKRGEDPPFPGGESTQDVSRRLQAFLDEKIPPAGPPVALVTHNVVIRCMIGQVLKLPVSTWWRIPVEHMDAYQFQRNQQGWFWEPRPEQWAVISDALRGQV